MIGNIVSLLLLASVVEILSQITTVSVMQLCTKSRKSPEKRSLSILLNMVVTGDGSASVFG